MSNLHKAQDALDEKGVEAGVQAILRPGMDAVTVRDELRTAIAAYESAKPALPAPDCAELLDQCWQELVEKDDRTSPEEYPGMALITRDELHAFIATALESLSRQLNEAEAKVAYLTREKEYLETRGLASATRAEAAEARIASLAGALEKISRALDREISLHRCACPHPCEDYLVHPGPCGTRTGESFRNIKVISDEALASLPTAGEKGEGPLQEARAIIKGFMGCAEIGDCDPRDKDPETRDLESRALRFINASSPSPDLITDAGKGEWRDIASVEPPHDVPVLLYSPPMFGSPLGTIEARPYSFGPNGCRSIHSYATHWMPLPASPKGGENAVS